MHSLAYSCCKGSEIHIDTAIRWNLSVTDTVGPDIFGNFLLQYRGLPPSEVKNV